MRFILLSAATSLCAAVIIPDQEVLADDASLLANNESGQDEDTEVDSWWLRMTELSQNSNQPATEVAMGLLGLDVSLDGGLKAAQYEADKEWVPGYGENPGYGDADRGPDRGGGPDPREDPSWGGGPPDRGPGWGGGPPERGLPGYGDGPGWGGGPPDRGPPGYGGGRPGYGGGPGWGGGPPDRGPPGYDGGRPGYGDGPGWGGGPPDRGPPGYDGGRPGYGGGPGWGGGPPDRGPPGYDGGRPGYGGGPGWGGGPPDRGPPGYGGGRPGYGGGPGWGGGPPDRGPPGYGGGRPGYGDGPGWGGGPPDRGPPGYGGSPGCGPGGGWPGKDPGDGGGPGGGGWPGGGEPGGPGPGGGGGSGPGGGGGSPGGGGGWPGGGGSGPGGGGGSGPGGGGGPGGGVGCPGGGGPGGGGGSEPGGGGGSPGGGGRGGGGGSGPGGGGGPGGGPGGGRGWPGGGGPGGGRCDPGWGGGLPGYGRGPGYGGPGRGCCCPEGPGRGGDSGRGNDGWPGDGRGRDSWEGHCSHFFLSPRFCMENHTLWELINESRKTFRLAELLKNHDDLVTLLNSSEGNYTLLAPTNSAIDRLLDRRHQPSFINELLQYHILPKRLDFRRVKNQQTLPTALNETSLGKNMPQRIVASRHQRQVVLNGASEVIAGDIIGSNGILHQINTPLIPPPNTSTILRLLPDHFSTFALGLEKAELAHHLTGDIKHSGTTFAPTNAAFNRLGPHANEYLFSEGGKKCLQALLRYHLVPDRTLYSDILYDQHGHMYEFGSGKRGASVHIKLTTLLKNRKLSVDVSWPGMSVVMRINGVDTIRVHDVLARDGVLHVLDQVLVPPKKLHVGEKDGLEEISMETLKDSFDECKGMPRAEL